MIFSSPCPIMCHHAQICKKYILSWIYVHIYTLFFKLIYNLYFNEYWMLTLHKRFFIVDSPDWFYLFCRSCLAKCILWQQFNLLEKKNIAYSSITDYTALADKRKFLQLFTIVNRMLFTSLQNINFNALEIIIYHYLLL